VVDQAIALTSLLIKYKYESLLLGGFCIRIKSLFAEGMMFGFPETKNPDLLDQGSYLISS
jgi:hypothetical protein